MGFDSGALENAVAILLQLALTEICLGVLFPQSGPHPYTDHTGGSLAA